MTDQQTPREAINKIMKDVAQQSYDRGAYGGWTDDSTYYAPDDATNAVIAYLWEQVDSYDFFDALETWVNSNDNYEPEDIARFTAEHLLGHRPTEQENDDA